MVLDDQDLDSAGYGIALGGRIRVAQCCYLTTLAGNMGVRRGLIQALPWCNCKANV
jgi:hypothetical protein